MYYKNELSTYYLDGNCFVNSSVETRDESIHTHDFLELVYSQKGKSVHFVDGKEYLLNEGDLLFINCGSTHSFNILKPPFKYVDIMIKPEFINNSLTNTNNAFSLLRTNNFKDFEAMVDQSHIHIHFKNKERTNFDSLISLIIDEQENANSGSEIILRSIYNTILTLVFRKMSLKLSEDYSISSSLLEYINENCAEQISLKEIASQNHYNPTYFSRLFKKQTGVTFSEYITNCRLTLACQLLLETDYTVGKIASKVGFSDKTKFFKLFSKKTGTTPLKYRKSKN